MSDSAFSINLGEKYVQIADASKAGAEIKINALAFDEAKANIYVTEGEKPSEVVSGVISKLVADTGIKKKGVDLVIPDSHSYSRIIEMPLLTEKELVSAIRYQADQFVPIPIEKVNLDIEILSTNKKDKKLSILIIAAPITVVDRAVSTIESIGLSPETVENEASASLRLISDHYQSAKEKGAPSEMKLFMNFGFSSTSLYLYEPAIDVAHDIHNFGLGVELFSRSIRANLNSSDDEIKRMLEVIGLANVDGSSNVSDIIMSSYNEIVAEISKFIISAKSKFNASITELFVFGEGYKVAGLTDKMTTSLGISSSLFSLYDVVPKNNVVEFFKNDMPLFVPSIGATIR